MPSEPVLHLNDPSRYKGTIFSFNKIMTSEIAELITFYSHKPKISQFISTCFHLLDKEKIVTMGQIEESLKLSRTTILAYIRQMYKDNILEKGIVTFNSARNRSLYVFKLPQKIVEANFFEKKQNKHNLTNKLKLLSSKKLEQTIDYHHNKDWIRAERFSIFSILSALPNRNGFSKQKTSTVWLGEYSFDVTISPAPGYQTASIIDLRTLFIVMTSIDNYINEHKQLKNNQIKLYIDDFLHFMNLKKEGANTGNIMKSLLRWSKTEFQITGLPSILRKHFSGFLSENQSFRFINKLQQQENEPKSKSPDTVWIELNPNITKSITQGHLFLIHNEFINSSNPSGFEMKLYIWCRGAVGAITSLQCFSYDEIKREVDVSCTNNIFKHYIKRIYTNNRRKDTWATLGNSYLFRIQMNNNIWSFEFRANPEDKKLKIIRNNIQSS
jgi:predicted transcriptional regulator